MGSGCQSIEIARELNQFGAGRGAIKVDRLERVFCGITRGVGIILYGIHRQQLFVEAFFPFVTRFHFISLPIIDSLKIKAG